MKEIGGYIEFENFVGQEYYSNAIKLNCSRNAMAYILEAEEIRRVWFPYFMCDSVKKVCYKHKCEMCFYHIDEYFRPVDIMASKEDWVYVVNYYGQISHNLIKKMKEQYHNLILDNSQAFFSTPIDGINTIYNCRKFFGVSDGAYLFCDKKLNRKYLQDKSNERVHYLLGRYENSASEYYEESIKNNMLFENEPIKEMSKLTQNIMRAIDYERVKEIRTQNFKYLSEYLNEVNSLRIHCVNGAFMYPLKIDNASVIRKKLLEKKIYIPILWPCVIDIMEEDSLEYKLAKDILPIPCDQRYGEAEMNTIILEINSLIK